MTGNNYINHTVGLLNKTLQTQEAKVKIAQVSVTDPNQMMSSQTSL